MLWPHLNETTCPSVTASTTYGCTTAVQYFQNVLQVIDKCIYIQLLYQWVTKSTGPFLQYIDFGTKTVTTYIFSHHAQVLFCYVSIPVKAEMLEVSLNAKSMVQILLLKPQMIHKDSGTTCHISPILTACLYRCVSYSASVCPSLCLTLSFPLYDCVSKFFVYLPTLPLPYPT